MAITAQTVRQLFLTENATLKLNNTNLATSSINPKRTHGGTIGSGVMGNGNTGGLNPEYNLYDLVSAVIADIIPSGATPTFSEVLADNNITGTNDIQISDNQVIAAVNGGGTLNLRDLNDGQISITTDSGAYLQAWINLATTYGTIGFGSDTYLESTAEKVGIIHNDNTSAAYIGKNFLGLNLYANELAISKNIGIFDNALISASVGCDTGAVSINSGTTLAPTVFNAGIYNSPAVGGIGITVKTANTAYCNQLGFNTSGSLFEGLLDTATLTENRTYELPDASGTVGILRTIAVSTAHTAQTGEIILGDATAAGFNVTLPNPTGKDNMMITVKKLDATANKVTLIHVVGSIDAGAANTAYELTAQYDSVTIVSNGNNWHILATV